MLAAKTSTRLDSGRATPTVVQAKWLTGGKLGTEPSTDFLNRKATQPHAALGGRLSPGRGQSKFWKQNQEDKEPSAKKKEVLNEEQD